MKNQWDPIKLKHFFITAANRMETNLGSCIPDRGWVSRIYKEFKKCKHQEDNLIKK